MGSNLNFNFNFNVAEHGVLGTIYYKYFFSDPGLPLVITFASWGSISKQRVSEGLDPWGYSFIKGLGYNVLSFQCTEGNINYYRDKIFIQGLDQLGSDLPDFIERLSYGGSMGGYAATAFSKPLKVNRVLAINPISSRRRDLAAWDYEAGRGLKSFTFDWSGEYTDGAETSASGYVVYDPLYDLDKLHAIRYKNLSLLRVPGVGHGMPNHLLSMNMLKWLVDAFIKNDLSKDDFYRLARNRRNIKRYYQWMLSKENKKLTPMRKKILETRYLKIRQEILLNEDTSKYKGFLRKPSQKEIDKIRNMAVILEDIDIEAAYTLMNLAHKYRPDGLFIKNKVQEYSKIINCDNKELVT